MIRDAIKKLYPEASFVVENNTYKFLDDTQYDDQEIQDEITRLKSEFESDEYKRLRAAEYPSYADQFDKIFHDGIDAWKSEIQAIKSKYPKPE